MLLISTASMSSAKPRSIAPKCLDRECGTLQICTECQVNAARMKGRQDVTATSALDEHGFTAKDLNRDKMNTKHWTGIAAVRAGQWLSLITPCVCTFAAGISTARA